MVVADFLQFIALYAIMITGLRLLQAKFQGTEFGKTLAFFG